MKCFTEIYKKEDFEYVIPFYTKNNVQPWQVANPLTNDTFQTTTKLFIDGRWDTVTIKVFDLKLRFALDVWNYAIDETRNRYPDYLDYKWVTKNGHPIKRLKFTSKKRKEAEEFFYHQIKTVCDKKQVAVSEGYSLVSNYPPIGNPQLNIVIDTHIITSDIFYKTVDKFKEKRNFNFRKKHISFSFNEIENYFARSNKHILELINAEENVNNVREIDEVFIETAASLNIKPALYFLKLGANINAIDSFGNTALTKIAEAANDEFLYLRIEHQRWDKTPELIKINEQAIQSIKILLELGADINMFGYEGSTALHLAIVPGNHVLLEFLLKNGANPNITLNPYQTYTFDYSYYINEAHNYLGISGNKYVFEKMVKLLLDAGAVW